MIEDKLPMTRTIEIQDNTYRRLSAIVDEITHLKRKDLTLDDVLNELIDMYQDNSWSQFGAGAGGG
jgi:predicted CopG family antitoxin